jgi:hypothetical protein
MSPAELTAGACVLAVSLAPVLIGHAIRGRGGRAQLAGMAGYAVAGVAFGAYLCVKRDYGVGVAQGLEGGALAAGLLVLLPAALFLQLGYRVRPLLLACGVWFAALLPLLLYLLIVGLWISSDVMCPPGADCSPFS